MASVDLRNVQVLFLEMQPAVVASVRTIDQKVLCNAAGAVLQISRALELPTIASVVPIGSAAPELIEELSLLPPSTRTTITPFSDNGQRARIQEAGRKVLAVGGVSSEIAVLNTVLAARKAGYEVHVLMDCCGGLDERTEATALRQIELAGAIPSNVSSFFTAMVDDMATTEGGAIMGALAKLWSWDVDGEAAAPLQG